VPPLRIDGIGLAGAILVSPLGAENLKDLYSLGTQEASESRAEGSRTLHPGFLDEAESSGPPEQPSVACNGRRHAQRAPLPADPVEGDGHVGVLVGIYAKVRLPSAFGRVDDCMVCPPIDLAGNYSLCALARAEA